MVIKTLGSDTIRAQFLFFKINVRNHTQASMQKCLGDTFRIVQNKIDAGQLTSFVAFLENPSHEALTPHKNMYAIPGNINWLSVQNVESVLNEKIKHALPEYRKKGMQSTHPPKFLTLETVVIVMGSTKFLLRNMQLYLEQEGLLRDRTFELLIDIACLEVARGRRREDFLHLVIQDKTWYRGNLEALGDFASKAALASKQEEDEETTPLIMNDVQLLQHLSKGRVQV